MSGNLPIKVKIKKYIKEKPTRKSHPLLQKWCMNSEYRRGCMQRLWVFPRGPA